VDAHILSVGSLKVCELIACGGFSTVYKGLWQGLEVAIKASDSAAANMCV